jgi:predicted metalloprotease with PDZ domain
LWFFEGFTSYYDDLLLRRAGLIDDATYLKLLTKTVNQVLQTPGRHVQTVAQASFDAWVKYYRQDENTPNATVSYYTKGSLVALCLDLTLRSEGKTSLDAVMRGLWQRCQAGPMTQDDLLAVLQNLSGRSFAPELAHWVHSTAELPLEKLLASTGVAMLQEPSQMAQVLGIRVGENNGIQVKTVLRGGAAELAGFAAGDEWLGVEVDGVAGAGANKKKSAWRIQKLDDLKLYLGHAGKSAKPQKMTAVVARDKRLLNLPLQIPADITTCRLAVRDAKAVSAWLA